MALLGGGAGLGRRRRSTKELFSQCERTGMFRGGMPGPGGAEAARRAKKLKLLNTIAQLLDSVGDDDEDGVAAILNELQGIVRKAEVNKARTLLADLRKLFDNLGFKGTGAPEKGRQRNTARTQVVQGKPNDNQEGRARLRRPCNGAGAKPHLGTEGRAEPAAPRARGTMGASPPMEIAERRLAEGRASHARL